MRVGGCVWHSKLRKTKIRVKRERTSSSRLNRIHLSFLTERTCRNKPSLRETQQEFFIALVKTSYCMEGAGYITRHI